ncbi:MAG: hypothetical protein FWE35_20870 [Streptosporangiales bacterium]|nr:hypothetical protein [Streptosporangiales bacterium]
MKKSRKIATIVVSGVAAVAAASGAVAVPAAPASAAAACWKAGFNRLGYPAYYCHNLANTPVYDSNYAVVGYLYTRTNWFACRSDKGGYVGGPHPHRWELTTADNGRSGWVKDTSIYNETNPLQVCRT